MFGGNVNFVVYFPHFIRGYSFFLCFTQGYSRSTTS